MACCRRCDNTAFLILTTAKKGALQLMERLPPQPPDHPPVNKTRLSNLNQRSGSTLLLGRLQLVLKKPGGKIIFESHHNTDTAAINHLELFNDTRFT